MEIYSHGVIGRKLKFFEVIFLLSKLVKGISPNEPLVGEIINPAYEDDIQLMKVPATRVAKMGRRSHIEKFFEEGTLRLGTYEDFRTQGNAEIRDHQEGYASIVGLSNAATAFGTYQLADDSFIFCTYFGEPDPRIIKDFEYDDLFFIEDVVGFCSAVQSAIEASSFSFGTCVYCEEKALVGTLNADFDASIINRRSAELAGEATHYVKPEKYSHQNEFRMVWRMRNTVTKPIIIRCPEAIKYCSRV